ncbi:MAG: melibiose:sodium transporter MelB [bacterium]|nr:melibiose:sodium transporter MelB [bacterium]
MNNKLSWISKLSFGIGAFGKDAVYAIVGTFLLYYLTDIKMVAPAFVGTLFLVARIWDAFNDPFMGMVVDNTRSKFGKFRPWIMIGTVLNAIVLVFLYSNFNMSNTAYLVFVSIFYILWGMTYTIMDIPYWSMVPALSSNIDERNQMAAIPRFFASFAWLVVGSGGLYIVKFLGNGNEATGFSRFALIISLLFIVASIITVLNVKERVVATTQEKTTVKQMIHVLVKNDQVKVILGIALFFNIAYQLSNSFAIYYFKYVTGSPKALYTVYSGVAGFAQMGALALFSNFVKKFGKKTTFMVGSICPVVGWVILLVGGAVIPKNALFVGVCSAIVNAGIGFMLAQVTVILSEVVDYGEFKLKTRNESILFSMQTFVVKFAGAFSGFISGVGLTIIGYVPDTTQSSGAILGMRILMIALPSLLSMSCLFIYKRSYKLNDTYYRNMIDILEERKGEMEECI